MGMALKPQDVVVLLKLLLPRWVGMPYAALATELGMSSSEVHAAVQRAAAAGLINPLLRTANREAIAEFLIHGLKYVFPTKRGEMTRGIPTSVGAEPLAAQFQASDEPVPVWPDPEGKVRGYTLAPLYKSVPLAAKRDPELYILLILVDAIRSGRARERALAEKELLKQLESYAPGQLK